MVRSIRDGLLVCEPGAPSPWFNNMGDTLGSNKDYRLGNNMGHMLGSSMGYKPGNNMGRNDMGKLVDLQRSESALHLVPYWVTHLILPWAH
jgi:hypothetical protein